MSSARKTRTPLNTQRLTIEQLLAHNMHAFEDAAVLVVGDLILDHYLWGSVDRTTPEAPVAIVRHEHDNHALGGAANVAHNIAALGGRARLVGALGNDEPARQLKTCLKEAGISARDCIVDRNRKTTQKSRVVSAGQLLLRIDHESTRPVEDKIANEIIEKIQSIAPKCGAILLSDYAKGLLTPRIIKAAIDAGRKNKIPVLVDPKGRDYRRYQGADIMTPNQKEIATFTGIEIVNQDALEKAGRALIRECKLQALVATRDSEGLSIIRPRNASVSYPAKAPEVMDVTGGGDTAIATLALAIAAGLDLDAAGKMANHAGGIVVGKLGVATVAPTELAASLQDQEGNSKVRTLSELQILLANQQTKGRKIVFTNGCFDLLHAGHIQFLHQARRQGDLLVVGLNTDPSVRKIKG
ncbi:D-glycero-beta-D-manno-heptose-7-phosphate kinase, partial [candidate division KSB3 bacterium]|nr:D-glycero-beta-D-manno-heptose-7-phosphate kinase [candidate division KSB3 bacterium]